MKSYRVLTALMVAFLLGALLLANVPSKAWPNPNVNATPAATTTHQANIRDADQALFYGDYANAEQAYSAALGDPALKCDAYYGLGVVALRTEKPLDAENQLTLALQEQRCQTSFQTYQAYVLRGDARYRLKQIDVALQDYQAALDHQPGLIDSYLYERMASIGGDNGLKYLRLAAEAPRSPQTQLGLRKRLLQAYQVLNATPDIIKQYNAILSLSDQPDELADAEVGLANLEVADHQEAAAYARLQNVIAKYAAAPAAFSALVTLVSNGQSVDLLIRTRINVQNENYQPVITRVTAYLASTPAGQVPTELYVLLGKAQRGLNHINDAFATFQKVQDLYPTDPMASVAALEQAETAVFQKDNDAALKAYMVVATKYKTSPEAPEALWRAAKLAQMIGKTDQAVALYEQLASAYPNAIHAAEGMFQAGKLLMSTDPTRAAKLFGQANTAQGFVWQGKLLLQLNDAAGARRAWHSAATKDPGEFFSLRASDLLNGQTPYQAPAQMACCNTAPADQQMAEKWLSTVFKMASVSRALPDALANNPFLMRGKTLWMLGWWQQANDEFDALHRSLRDDPQALYQLALYYKTLGVYRSSILAATRVLVLSNMPYTNAPRFIAQLAYPLAYANLVLPAAKANNLDPLYVAALIRTESTFDPTALSSADARGLMQILPSTGQELADRLNLPGFSTATLYSPQVNIKLGTAYLAALKHNLNDDASAALAAYNAGGGYVQGLLAQSGHDLDQFYQAITVDETRQYIEYTYQTYAMYKLLYGVATF